MISRLLYVFALLANTFLLAAFASAQTPPNAVFETVVAFTGSNGNYPLAGLTLAKDGTLYGTTCAGGDFNHGTIFRLTTSGVFTRLVSFTGQNGAKPWAPLLEGKDGYFYGTTIGEGASNSTYGSIFRMSATGVLTNLHTFNPNAASGPHGASPEGALIQTADGTIHGTTTGGASEAANGSIYTITPAGQFSVVLDFTKTAPYTGDFVAAPLLYASDGYFYGTTWGGGTNDAGTIYRFKTAADFTTLVNFGDDAGRGQHTFSTLLEASDGYFYGNTLSGVFFRLSRTGVFTIIHDFANQSLNPVIEASDGCLYGATIDSVFRYNLATGVLDQFPNTAGYEPWGPLVEAKNGILYGTLYGGNCVFKMTLPPVVPADIPDALQVGKPVSYQVAANRVPAGYTASGLPPGLSIDATTGLITGTPTGTGTFTATVSATNVAGTGSSLIVFTVAALPPPVINSPATATAQITQSFFYQIVATNSPTGYTATGLPAGLTIDPMTGVISGFPADGDTPGSYLVTLGATNSGGTATLTLNLTLDLAPLVVTLTAPTPTTAFGSSESGAFTLVLNRPAVVDLIVFYLVKGSAVNGGDYVLLKGTAKIKAGKTSRAIKVRALGDGGGAKKVVKLVLQPGNGYRVGTAGPVKVKILPPDQ